MMRYNFLKYVSIRGNTMIQRNQCLAKNLITDFIKIGKEAKLKIRLGHIFSGDLERPEKYNL